MKQNKKTVRLFKMSCFPSISLTLKVGFYSISSINDTVNNESDTVNDTATRLITLIKAHPEYTYDEYAKALNMGRATVARHIKKLNGIIKRIGSDKDGHWEFIIKEQ